MSNSEPSNDQPLIDYIVGSPVALTLSGPSATNFALIAANSAFSKLTGYENERIVGKNCRFLQGDYAQQSTRRKISDYLSDEAQNNFRGLIVNVRADGEPFINLLFLAKLRNRSGACRFVVGSQFDASRTHVTALRTYDRDLAQIFKKLRASPAEDSVVARGSFEAMASAVGAIARAKMMLAEL